jgi:subtilisin family serine protease
MGTAVGDDGGSNQIGMAPGAKWIGCRNMDEGNGTPATYLECFEFFLAPYPITGTTADGVPEMAPDVTVNSWSCPEEEGCEWDTLQLAVEAQRAAGIMTVVAASNSGSDCSTVNAPPGIYDAAYSIGALNNGADSLASFSSRGPVTADGSNRLKPDLAAPGTSIRSSIPGGSYSFKQGTSMATPHVAGAVALLWSAKPELKNDIEATEALLNDYAVHLSTTACSSSGWPNNLFGYGRLDILATVNAALGNIAPQAAFTYTSSLVNQPVSFFDTTPGSVLTSTWHFGDGLSLTLTSPNSNPITHLYTSSGLYTVTLMAENNAGSSTVSDTVLVRPVQSVNYLPVLQK